MRHKTMRAARAAVGVLAFLSLVGSSSMAQEAHENDSYTWSAELVAFDDATDTVTVKAITVEYPRPDIAALKPGERVMLTWSGITMAAGVRAIERGKSSSFDRMTMPVEIVSTESDGRYVTFKVPIPAKDAAKIAALTPGVYVTATSPQRAKDASDAVTSIRAYNDVG